MRIHLRQLCVLLLLVTSAKEINADVVFKDKVLELLSAARLRKSGGKAEIAVVVGTAGDLAKAERMAENLQAGAREWTSLEGVVTVKAYRLPDNRDASSVLGTTTAAVVVLHASPKNLSSLHAFSSVYPVLTISRRPQDLGQVSIVILWVPGPKGRARVWQTFFDAGRLAEERIEIEIDQSKWEPVKSPKYKKGLKYKDDFLTAKQDADKQGAKPDWNDIIRRLRMAALAEKKENPTPGFTKGTNNIPYAPHFYLSEALARIGDCDGARDEWNQSDPKVRQAIRPKSKVDEVNKLVHKTCRHQQPREGELAWDFGSF